MLKSSILHLSLLIFILGSGFAQDWQTDFEKAKKVASMEDKSIILVFQGSDWCAPCIKLDREIWSTEEFNNYAKDHFVMLKADFPRKKKNALNAAQQVQNKILAETYNKNGHFPFVAILNENGEILGSTGYKKTSPKEYIKILESFKC